MESNHLLPAYKVGTLTNELSFHNRGDLLALLRRAERGTFYATV